MSKRFKQKEILPDPQYDNILVAKFINQLMIKGKKQQPAALFIKLLI